MLALNWLIAKGQSTERGDSAVFRCGFGAYYLLYHILLLFVQQK
jgi:hypothetical protein